MGRRVQAVVFEDNEFFIMFVLCRSGVTCRSHIPALKKSIKLQ